MFLSVDLLPLAARPLARQGKLVDSCIRLDGTVFPGNDLFAPRRVARA